MLRKSVLDPGSLINRKTTNQLTTNQPDSYRVPINTTFKTH